MDALQLYQRALTSIEKTLGSQHSEAAEILHNIGQVQHQLGLLLLLLLFKFCTSFSSSFY